MRLGLALCLVERTSDRIAPKISKVRPPFCAKA
nr:MAG TPA: hypothetical protein [Caudoviricetes sp.]